MCPRLIAEAIPSEYVSYQPLHPPLDELTPEEENQLILPKTDSNASTTASPSVIQPKEAPMLPVAPSDQVIQNTPSAATTIKALNQASLASTTLAYQQKYKDLKAHWKSMVRGSSIASGYTVFFQQDDLPIEETLTQKSTYDSSGINTLPQTKAIHQSAEALSSGNLTSNAIQALMLRYLSDNPEIDIPVNSINCASAFVTAENTVSVDEALLKSTVLDPALDAFTKKNRSMYASVLQLAGAGKGQYIIVVVDKHGNVSLIDPDLKRKSYDNNLLSGIVKSLNTQRKATDLKFVAAETDSIIYTGLNGQDTDNTRSGLYAYAYWTAIIANDKLDAYQSVNGAATEETSALDSYDSINLSGVYSKKVKKTPGLKQSMSFELDLREWLRTQINFD